MRRLSILVVVAVLLGVAHAVADRSTRDERTGRSAESVAAEKIARAAKTVAIAATRSGEMCARVCGPDAGASASAFTLAGSGKSCSFAKRVAVPAVIGERGALTGAFDPAVSGVCEGACAARSSYRLADVVPQPGARVGQFTQCPVSGVVFQVRKAGPTVVDHQRTFFTCCGGCAGRLEADPERFLKS